MSDHGLLIDYRYCTGCHSCELACQQEHGYGSETMGIEVRQIGPFQISDRKWQYDNLPVLTDFCDLCAQRTVKGKPPTCVQHCQAGCMSYGLIEDLAREMKHHKMTLYR